MCLILFFYIGAEPYRGGWKVPRHYYRPNGVGHYVRILQKTQLVFLNNYTIGSKKSSKRIEYKQFAAPVESGSLASRFQPKRQITMDPRCSKGRARGRFSNSLRANGRRA